MSINRISFRSENGAHTSSDVDAWQSLQNRARLALMTRPDGVSATVSTSGDATHGSGDSDGGAAVKEAKVNTFKFQLSSMLTLDGTDDDVLSLPAPLPMYVNIALHDEPKEKPDDTSADSARAVTKAHTDAAETVSVGVLHAASFMSQSVSATPAAGDGSPSEAVARSALGRLANRRGVQATTATGTGSAPFRSETRGSSMGPMLSASSSSSSSPSPSPSPSPLAAAASPASKIAHTQKTATVSPGEGPGHAVGSASVLDTRQTLVSSVSAARAATRPPVATPAGLSAQGMTVSGTSVPQPPGAGQTDTVSDVLLDDPALTQAHKPLSSAPTPHVAGDGTSFLATDSSAVVSQHVGSPSGMDAPDMSTFQTAEQQRPRGDQVAQARQAQSLRSDTASAGRASSGHMGDALDTSYRFSSWGNQVSVSLRRNPSGGAAVMATASDGRLHDILAETLKATATVPARAATQVPVPMAVQLVDPQGQTHRESFDDGRSDSRPQQQAESDPDEDASS